jgi:hypothetical protein
VANFTCEDVDVLSDVLGDVIEPFQRVEELYRTKERTSCP